MELSIIILNWNAAMDTLRCVRAIKHWEAVTPSIYIVDNASHPEDYATLAQSSSHVHLIRNAENRGFAGGNNQGIQASIADGPSPILLLNNDAFIEEDDVLRLLETLNANPRIGFVGPLLYDAEKPDHLLSAGGRSPLHHQTHIPTLGPGPRLRVVDYVPGTVILIRSEVLREVGLLDEDYFFSTEVADLCLRAKRHGYRSVVDTAARATHTLSRSSQYRKTLYVYYIIRNRFLYIRKFHPRSRVLLYGIWGLYSLAIMLKTHLSGHPSTAQAMGMGLQDGVQGHFGNQNQRVLAACDQ
jgi:hypothetical protein